MKRSTEKCRPVCMLVCSAGFSLWHWEYSLDKKEVPHKCWRTHEVRVKNVFKQLLLKVISYKLILSNGRMVINDQQKI